MLYVVAPELQVTRGSTNARCAIKSGNNGFSSCPEGLFLVECEESISLEEIDDACEIIGKIVTDVLQVFLVDPAKLEPFIVNVINSLVS